MPSPFIGKLAPAFLLPALDGGAQAVSPADLQGRVGLLNVWAWWCAPCREEHPLLVAEARVQAVSAELRCLVCQNQSLADSRAELAVDLKNQVREQLRAGRTADEVVAYMTDRCGDFVRYRPPFKAMTPGRLRQRQGPGQLGHGWHRRPALLHAAARRIILVPWKPLC